jgi:DNase/tRNase domain of colicin-like bacteriocin
VTDLRRGGILRDWLVATFVSFLAFFAVLAASPAVAHSSTPAANAAKFIYDVVPVARVDARAFVSVENGSFGSNGAREGSVSLSVDARGVSTTLADSCVATEAAGSGGQYSVAYESQLDSSVLGRSRSVHFNRANQALDEAMAADPAFASQMDSMIPGVQDSVGAAGGRQTPDGWTWHHAPSANTGGETGVMQLVPTVQHTPGSAFWPTLHPNGVGGCSEWAIPAGAPKN